MTRWKNKSLSLLQAFFDLISVSSLSMKIQIMGRKITENLGFKSLLRKVKTYLYFFLFIFKFFTQKGISFIFATFWHLLWLIRNQIKDIQKWLQTKTSSFLWEFENEKKIGQNFFDLLERGFEPQIFSNFSAHDLNFQVKWGARDRVKKAS